MDESLVRDRHQHKEARAIAKTPKSRRRLVSQAWPDELKTDSR